MLSLLNQLSQERKPDDEEAIGVDDQAVALNDELDAQYDADLELDDDLEDGEFDDEDELEDKDSQR